MSTSNAAKSEADLVHVGNDGWLFLVAGSNNVIDMYKNDSSFTEKLLADWLRLLRERSARLNKRGIEYLHMAAPEKLTVLHKYYNGELENLNGSPILQLIHKHGGQIPCMLNLVPYFTSQIDQMPVYWKTDTHWSFYGCFSAYQLLCGRLGVEFNADLMQYPFGESDVLFDLGAKIDGQPTEKARFYQLAQNSKRVYANQVVKFKEKYNLVDEGALHVGSHVVYQNDSDTAVDKKVVLFGDSFSEYRPHLLMGMLAETFREVHFIWSANLDYDYIDFVKPDIVISELAERFMTRVPTDQLTIQTFAGERLTEFKKNWVEPEMPEELPESVIEEHKVFLPETYALDKPKTVQGNFSDVEHDTQMNANPINVTVVNDAKVFFNGGQSLVQAPGGEVVDRYNVSDTEFEALKKEHFRKVDGTVMLFASSQGAHCYYHWMVDLLPKFGVLNKVGIDLSSIDYFLARDMNDSFHVDTLAHFGIDKSRVLLTEHDQYLECDKLIHVELNNAINMKMNRFVPLWLKHVYPAPADTGERIKLYISRPDGVRRGVSNEAELKPILEEFGYVVTAMEGMKVQQQVELLAKADVLISPHGGALTNMIFCRPGIKVCELFGQHVYPFYYGLAQMCGHDYHTQLLDTDLYRQIVQLETATTVGTPEEQWSTAFKQFEVDPAVFRKTLESLE